MTWIVIVVVLLVAFGPIFWLVPSKKDQRLNRFRARARQEGLVVEIRNLPKPDPEPHERVSAGGVVRIPVIQCATYSLRFVRKLRYLPVWRIVRKASDRPDPLPAWSYDERPGTGEDRRHLEEMLTLVGPFLERLPADVIALQVSRDAVVLYWLEAPANTEDTVSVVAGLLRDFEAAAGALEAAIEAQLIDDDS